MRKTTSRTRKIAPFTPYHLGELRKAFGRIEAALDELTVQIKSTSIWLRFVTQQGR